MAVDVYAPTTEQGLQGIAGMDLSGHRVVRPSEDGTLVYADPSDPPEWGAGPWWLTIGAAAEGFTVALLDVGEMAEPSWAWTPGSRLFLTTGGVLSPTPPLSPTRMVQVAVARTATTIWFDPQMPIETA